MKITLTIDVDEVPEMLELVHANESSMGSLLSMSLRDQVIKQLVAWHHEHDMSPELTKEIHTDVYAADPLPKKRGMTPEGRARMSRMMKKRWRDKKRNK